MTDESAHDEGARDPRDARGHKDQGLAPAAPVARVAWIRTVPEDEAGSDLASLYRAEADPATGRVDHILKVHGLLPASLDDHARLYHTILHSMGRTSLADRELIGLVVSTLNSCRY